MDCCPACGSSRIYPSRLRSTGERLRHLLTGMQPHRCHQCDWRQWARVDLHAHRQGQTRPDELRGSGPQTFVKPVELDRLDPQ